MKNTILLICVAFTNLLLAGEATFSATQDAYTCDCAPNATNPNGGETYLYQGRVGSCFCNYFIEWGLWEIAPGTSIESAELWIYCKSFTGSAGAGNPVYHPITEAWDENTITYNTMPSWDISIRVTSGWPGASSWFVLDLTDVVQFWVDNPADNYGMVADVENTTSTSCPGFYSSNFADPELRPYLLVSATGLSTDNLTWGEVKIRNGE